MKPTDQQIEELAEILMQSESLPASIIIIKQFLETHSSNKVSDVSAEEVLKKYFIRGRKDCIAPMHEYASILNKDSAGSDAIKFADWISGEGYRQYDGVGRWIAPHNNNNVYSTKQLYKMFQESQPKKESK